MSKYERKSEMSLSEQSSKAAEEVRALGRAAAAKAGHAVAHLRKRVKVTVDDYIVEHPVKVVLIAMGVGGLLGFLLRRPL